MSLFFMPLSLLPRRFFSTFWLPFSTLPGLTLLILAVVLLVLKRNTFKDGINTKVLSFVFFSIGLVGITSFLRFGEAQVINPSLNVRNFLILVLGFISPFVLLHESIRSKKDIQNFIRGSLILLFLLNYIGAIQAIYVYFGQLGFLAEFFGYFEWRFPDRDNWYHLGSYVQTMNRINGLMPEASFYAVQLGVLSFPLTFACLKNNLCLFGENLKFNRIFYLYLLVSSIILNIIAQTTTGILLAVISLGFIFLYILKNQPIIIAKIFGIVSILIGILVIVLYFVTPGVHEFINIWIFRQNSPGNRWGSTVAYFRVFLRYPLLGAQNPNVFALTEVPIQTTQNREFIQNFLPNRQIQNLSLLLNWFGMYGIVIMGPIIFYFTKKIRAYKKMAQETTSNTSESVLFLTLKDMFFYYVVMYVIASLFIFEAFNLTFILMFFFFIVALGVFTRERQNGMESLDKEGRTGLEFSRVERRRRARF